MATILCLNNYDLRGYPNDNRPAPDHFLYGVNHLHRLGYQIVVGGDETRRVLQWVHSAAAAARLPIHLGDLHRQWNALAELARADLVYSPCDSVAQGLSYLRAVGLLRVPIVCVAHHPPLGGQLRALRRPWVRLALRGVDAFPSLSRCVADELNQLAPGRHLSEPLPWGPDLTFYPPYTPPGRGVISAGRTGRDFVTFGIAASRTTSPATIVCPSSYITPEFREFGPNVAVLDDPNPIHFSYRQLVDMYARARAIAIPMQAVSGLCGLTSLLDALGMGRAVVMTRNRLIDIDVEKEGIGFWVNPGDVEGWQRAIQFLDDNAEEAVAMGRRARRLAEERYNSRVFGERIAEIVGRFLPPRATASAHATVQPRSAKEVAR